MQTSTAYFAGAGTVIAAIVGGVGGGLLIANMIAPQSPKGTEITRLERRMSPDPIQASPDPVQVAATPSQPAPSSAPSHPPASSAAAATVPAPTEAASSQTLSAGSAPKPAQPNEAAVTPVQPAAREPNREPSVAPQKDASEDALARPRNEARDIEVKRAVEKRRTERRQQWAERRRQQQRQEQELQSVEETVRDETGPRRMYAVEPVRVEIPRIRLFGEE